MILIHTIVKNNEHLNPVEIAGEISILNIETGKYLFLNETASFIWRLISDPLEVSTIIDRIIDEYNVPKEECQERVIAVLDEMLTSKLIEIKI